MAHLNVYTDGSYRPPHHGSWAYVVVKDDKIIAQKAEGVDHTTINRMELLAIQKALESLDEPSTLTIFSDSKYAVMALSFWMKGWEKKGWMTNQGTPVKNKEIFVEIDRLAKKHQVRYKWIKGHNGDQYNEICDSLAQDVTKKAVLAGGGNPDAKKDPEIKFDFKYGQKKQKKAVTEEATYSII